VSPELAEDKCEKAVKARAQAYSHEFTDPLELDLPEDFILALLGLLPGHVAWFTLIPNGIATGCVVMRLQQISNASAQYIHMYCQCPRPRSERIPN